MASENTGNHSTRTLVGVGDLAPDVALEDATGQPVQLATFWQAQPLVLVFIRHFG